MLTVRTASRAGWKTAAMDRSRSVSALDDQEDSKVGDGGTYVAAK